VDEADYDTDSDTNSLSPPPPSTGPKTQALPKVEPVQKGSLLEEEESDLESLTDSNGDPPQDVEAGEAKDENMSESERPGAEDEDEEEGEGDVTMRAGDTELELEVEGVEEKEEKRGAVAEEVHVDESGQTGEQEAQAEEEAQPEEPVEEEVEEAPRKLGQ
jgi:hypothetical protein